MRVYLASGWFSAEQESARLEIKEVLEEVGISFFSPKDDNLAGEDAPVTELDKVVHNNITEINNCDYMVASTIGKDMGTLFETGYAYAREVPIIFYAPGLEGNFNLMLARTGHAVATNREDLLKMAQRGFPRLRWQGLIE